MKTTNSKVSQLNTSSIVVSAVEYPADVGKLIALDKDGGEGRCGINNSLHKRSQVVRPGPKQLHPNAIRQRNCHVHYKSK
jgi:hypothetical protein